MGGSDRLKKASNGGRPNVVAQKPELVVQDDLMRELLLKGLPQTPAMRHAVDGLLTPSSPLGDLRVLSQSTTARPTSRSQLPSGLDAGDKALEGLKREPIPEALTEVHETFVFPALGYDIHNYLLQRTDEVGDAKNGQLPFVNRDYGVLVLRERSGIRSAELVKSKVDVERDPLKVAYDADDFLGNLGDTSGVYAVIPLFRRNPFPEDFKSFLDFRHKVMERLGGVKVFAAGIIDASATGIDMQVHAVNPMVDGDAALTESVSRILQRGCDITRDVQARFNVMTGNINHTQVTTIDTGYSEMDAVKAILELRKKFTAGFYTRLFGEDEVSTQVIPAQMDDIVGGLVRSGGRREADYISGILSQVLISQTCFRNMLHNTNYVVNPVPEKDEPVLLSGLPSFTAKTGEKIAFGSLSEESIVRMEERLQAGESRLLGWMTFHTKNGQRVGEFITEEAEVASRLQTLENPQVVMLCHGAMTASDYREYVKASERIQGVPVHLGYVTRLNEFESIFKVFTPNPDASPEEVGRLLGLCDAVENDILARNHALSQEVARKHVAEVGTKVFPSAEIRDEMHARARFTGDYIIKRFGDEELAKQAEHNITHTTDLLWERKKGVFEISDSNGAVNESIFNVCQAAFRTLLIQTGAVNEVEVLSADGVKMDSIPTGREYPKYKLVRDLLSPMGTTYLGLNELVVSAMDFGENASFLMPLADAVASQELDSISSATFQNIMKMAPALNPLLSGRTAPSEASDRVLCAIVARGREREMVCGELMPSVNQVDSVAKALESIYSGSLAGRQELNGLRTELPQLVKDVTGRNLEELRADRRLMGIHCDTIAGAILTAVGKTCSAINTEADSLEQIAGLSNREIIERFLGKASKRERDRFKPDNIRNVKKSEARAKRKSSESLRESFKDLKPEDDEALFKAELSREVLRKEALDEFQRRWSAQLELMATHALPERGSVTEFERREAEAIQQRQLRAAERVTAAETRQSEYEKVLLKSEEARTIALARRLKFDKTLDRWKVSHDQYETSLEEVRRAGIRVSDERPAEGLWISPEDLVFACSYREHHRNHVDLHDVGIVTYARTIAVDGKDNFAVKLARRVKAEREERAVKTKAFWDEEFRKAGLMLPEQAVGFQEMQRRRDAEAQALKERALAEQQAAEERRQARLAAARAKLEASSVLASSGRVIEVPLSPEQQLQMRIAEEAKQVADINIGKKQVSEDERRQKTEWITVELGKMHAEGFGEMSVHSKEMLIRLKEKHPTLTYREAEGVYREVTGGRRYDPDGVEAGLTRFEREKNKPPEPPPKVETEPIAEPPAPASSIPEIPVLTKADTRGTRKREDRKKERPEPRENVVDDGVKIPKKLRLKLERGQQLSGSERERLIRMGILPEQLVRSEPAVQETKAPAIQPHVIQEAGPVEKPAETAVVTQPPAATTVEPISQNASLHQTLIELTQGQNASKLLSAARTAGNILQLGFLQVGTTGRALVKLKDISQPVQDSGIDLLRAATAMWADKAGNMPVIESVLTRSITDWEQRDVAKFELPELAAAVLISSDMAINHEAEPLLDLGSRLEKIAGKVKQSPLGEEYAKIEQAYREVLKTIYPE